MTCDEVEARLDDYVDGSLPEGEFQEVELHLAHCAACREQERRLRLILAHARALPRELGPARDLWPGVAERIEAGRGWRPSWWATAALAAAAAVAAAVGVTLLGTRPEPAPVAPVATMTARFDRGSIGAAEQEYEQAATALMAALQERRETLSPETIASVEKNLEVIDRALAEVRTALERDPGNKELTRMLVSTYRKKVDTLRRVVRLSTAL